MYRAFLADATILDAAKRRYFLKQIGRSVATVNFLPPLLVGA